MIVIIEQLKFSIDSMVIPEETSMKKGILFVLAVMLSLTCCPGLSEAQTYTITDLGTLWNGPPGSRGGGTAAYGINNLGQVVGTSFENQGGWHPFVWDTNSGMVDLGTLGACRRNGI